MLDPLDFDAKPLARTLRRARLHAGSALLFERLSSQSWRILIWVLFFAGLWLFQLPAYFGQAGAIIAVIAFISGCGFFLYKDFRYFRFPSVEDIDRRIEEDSRLPHRPLSTIEDSLANPLKTESRALWLLSKQRAAKIIKLLKPVLPRSFLPHKDPYALRFGVLMFFVLGLVVAGADWKPRLAHGIAPFVYADAGKKGNNIRLVITPPEYTGMKQAILENSSTKKINIPTGSMLKTTVRSVFGRPVLKIDGAEIPMESAGNGNYIAEFTAPPGERLAISQFFFPLASWNYNLVPDTKPKITIEGKMGLQPEGAVRVPFSVEDDYGVRSIVMQMELDEAAKKPALGKPIIIRRMVLSGPKTPTDIQLTYDLASHPWAGLPVKLSFTAEDAISQKSESLAVALTLPERKFTEKAAIALMDVRKQLIAQPLENYREIIEKLTNIMIEPDSFRRDNIVLLSLRSATSRLIWSETSAETAEAVVSLLWDTALRIEDGNLSLAARRLQDAQTALETALQNPDATPEELGALMMELRMAMAEYFTELQREMQKDIAQGKTLNNLSPEMFSQVIDPSILGAMLEQMQAQIMSGDRKSAEEMLSHLRNMMDMMAPASAELPPQMQKLIEALKDMKDLLTAQKTLRAQTAAQAALQHKAGDLTQGFGTILPENPELMKQWGLENMPPPPQEKEPQAPAPLVDTRENQKQQELLRFHLGQMMLKANEAMDSIPPNMSEAEQEMRKSSQELWNNQPKKSVGHQTSVINHLENTQQQMQQALLQQIQNMTGLALGSSMRYDPLGRPYGGTEGGPGFGSSVKIPDEAERKRAQEILRLLQKRAGEFDRPESELDYYRRLLRQF